MAESPKPPSLHAPQPPEIPTPTVPRVDLAELGWMIKAIGRNITRIDKKLNPLIPQFGVFNILNYLNGHDATPELKAAMEPILEEFEIDDVRDSAEFFKDEWYRSFGSDLH